MESAQVADHSIKVGILTVSDSCFNGSAQDKSGPGLKERLESNELFSAEVYLQAIVPDDGTTIQDCLVQWCDSLKLNLIVTTGGTGFSPRDVTPEATKSVLEKEAPGIVMAMLMSSLKITPYAALARPACGIRGQTLIINLPGSAKASLECLDSIMPVLPHAFALLNNMIIEVVSTHEAVQQAPPVKKRGKKKLERIAKIFLCDPNHWQVKVIGNHVPLDSGVIWRPPDPMNQPFHEDIRDNIVRYTGVLKGGKQIATALKQQASTKIPPTHELSKKVIHFMSSRKRRRRDKDFNYSETVDIIQQEDNVDFSGITADYPAFLVEIQDGENVMLEECFAEDGTMLQTCISNILAPKSESDQS